MQPYDNIRKMLTVSICATKNCNAFRKLVGLLPTLYCG